MNEFLISGAKVKVILIKKSVFWLDFQQKNGF
jgi:hypothetical protein